jgi:hypothetical protein
MLSLDCCCRPLRALGIIGLMLLQFLLPCLATAQAGKPVDGSATNMVGVVNSLTGAVFVRSASGQEVAAKPGDAISRRTIVRTGVSGEVILLFADGLHVTLSENTTFYVDEYRFDADNSKANRAVFTLTAGAIRLVTGAMHAVNRDALIVRGGEAQVSVISKEVTAFVVHVETRPEVEVDVAVILGQVSIRTYGGSSHHLAQHQFMRWRRGAASLAQPLAAAPAGLQAFARSPAPAEGAPLDLDAAAELAKLLINLPASAAGEPAAAEPRVALAEFILPVVTPGGGGGCVGSPC